MGNCVRNDGDCSLCYMFIDGECWQDNEPQEEISDADNGL